MSNEELFEKLMAAVARAKRLHSNFAEGPYQALGVLGEEYGEVVRAVTKNEGWERVLSELIDLMASSEISYIQKAGMLMRNVYANSFMPFFDQLADEKDLPIDSKDILGFIDIFHEFIEWFKEISAKIQSFFASLA